MTDGIEERLAALLEAATKAEEETKAGLRRMAVEVIMARIEEGEHTPYESLLDLVYIQLLKAAPQSEFTQSAAEGIAYRTEEKAKLMRAYKLAEPYIDKMDGKDLYNLIRRLLMKRRERPTSLQRTLKTLRTHQT